MNREVHVQTDGNPPNRKALEERLKGIAGKIRQLDNFFIVSNHDCDGLTAAAILIKALQLENKKILGNRILKQLYTETVNELQELQKELKFENIIFTDLGSSYLKELQEAFDGHFFVLDHHQVTTDHENHFNANTFGFNGSSEISASGTCYLLAKELNANNMDLTALAVVGACGDIQDSTGKLIGLNAEIVIDGVQAGVLEVKQDVRLYGRITRPLVQYLQFASGPVLPGLTGNESACINFLQKNGIELKDGEKWRSYEDLNWEEKQKLVSALVMYLQEQHVPEWKMHELIGEVYTLSKELTGTALRDAKEFGTLLNACGRWNKSEIALQVCLGNRSQRYEEALRLLQNHRKELSQGLKFMQEKGIEEREHFYYFDAGTEIKDGIIGIVAGMLYGSGVIGLNKPIVALARYEDGSIKLSARASSELVRQGLNLGKALKEAAKEIEGAEAGGHLPAGGSRIPLEKKEEYLQALEMEIKQQLGKL